MDLKVFCVHDSCADSYLPPFCLPSTKEAVRAFRVCVNEKGHNFSGSPGDYSLFHLGDFDTDSGELRCLPAPKYVVNGLSVLARPEEELSAEEQLSLVEETEETVNKRWRDGRNGG